MRMSRLFGRTLREVPQEAELESHRLLLRAGMIRRVAAGIYAYLPLGRRVLAKIAEIIRQEMDAIEGQELLMPVVHPAELWQESGRWYEVGPEMVRFQDRLGRDMVLGITHEETITDLVRREVNSYRQLPLMLYQIQTKFRDEPRPRGGLIRMREFTMKDGYSFHAAFEDLEAYYPRVYQAYSNIFRRVGVGVMAVEASSGMMGGAISHEFVMPSEVGEDTLVHCPACGYAANTDNATFQKPDYGRGAEGELMEMATPGMETIQEVADYLGLPVHRTLKAVFYSAQGGVVFAVIRGDLEVNEAKLAGLLKVSNLRLASPEELKAAGIVAGYASPRGLRGEVKVVADDSIRLGANFVMGANREGYHLVNANYPRDFSVEVIGDIALAEGGHPCPRCGMGLKLQRGIELGHIFQLGTKYSEAMGARFLDAEGREHPLIMGCYGIGLDRLMAAVVEANHDGYGIRWPASIAPVEVYLVSLAAGESQVEAASDGIYAELGERGFGVLYDDRAESAGVKFNDADLIGPPLRLTVSKRTISQGGVELKRRGEKAYRLVPRADLLGEVARELAR